MAMAIRDRVLPAALMAVLVIAADTALAGPRWPSNQAQLTPGASYSPVASALPGDVRIDPPPAGANPALAVFSGIWSGSLCKGRGVDMKFAVEQITANGAQAVYASAAKSFGKFSERLMMRLDDGELQGALRRGARLAARLRPDGTLDFMWRWNSRRWCSGVLVRD
jgi:hypothetical protein